MFQLIGHNRVNDDNNNNKSAVLVTLQADVSINQVSLMICICVYQYVQLGHTQLLLYTFAVVAVVAAMDFTRIHKSIVVAAVDITRIHIFVCN